MKIDGYQTRVEKGLARASAQVTWEDCNRPTREVYFATDERFGHNLGCNPNAFLVAAIIPAMRHSERRVLVEGKLCPRLRNGLRTVMQQLRKWYGDPQHSSVAVDATEGFEPPLPRTPDWTASFMSGGVDAVTTLRCNRLDYPLEHPRAIRDCFLLHGFDIGGIEELDQNFENFEVLRASLSELAARANVTLVPVYTNVRYLDDNTNFFGLEVFGAALASVAHAFSKRITTAIIASSAGVHDLSPLGSHPLLDSNYSSSDVSILHDGTYLSRLEKVGIIAQWDVALQHLRSCNETFQSAEVLNCGKCEKCIRTMTHLLLHGKLSACPTYPFDDVTPEMLRTIKSFPQSIPEGIAPERRQQLLKWAYVSLSTANVGYWRELVEPLRAIGRYDLVKVVESTLAEFDKIMIRMDERDWRGKLKRFDQKFFDGRMLRLRRFVRGHLSLPGRNQ